VTYPMPWMLTFFQANVDVCAERQRPSKSDQPAQRQQTLHSIVGILIRVHSNC
jgi:hypothetical protein